LGHYHRLKARWHSNDQGWLTHMYMVSAKKSLNAKVDLPFDEY